MTTFKKPRKEYADLLPDVTRNRDAVAGERNVKLKTVEYLPPLASMTTSTYEAENGNVQIITGSNLTAEGSVSYRKYLSLAYFYGASGRTVDGLSGLIFSKKPARELNSSVEYLKNNIDGKGTTLRSHAQKTVQDAFISPWSGLLVDFPNISGNVSIADAESNNLRPKILFYPFESIIKWHYDVVNNEEKLTLLVLKENIETLRDRFDIEYREQYRVLEIVDGVYVQSILDSKGNDIVDREIIKVNGNVSNEIPFFYIKSGSEDKAVINDLVDANFNHYEFFSGYASKEHASAFPIFTETGVDGEDNNIMVGPGAKWTNRSVDAQFGVLQSASDGGSMRTYLLDMENRMAALGAEMLKPRIAGAESAEAKSLDQVAQNSTTGNIAVTVSEAYTKAINFCAKWLGAAEDNSYELNTDYNPASMNPQMLQAQMLAFQNGVISKLTLYENMQKGEVANSERSLDDEQGQINKEESGM